MKKKDNKIQEFASLIVRWGQQKSCYDGHTRSTEHQLFKMNWNEKRNIFSQKLCTKVQPNNKPDRVHSSFVRLFVSLYTSPLHGNHWFILAAKMQKKAFAARKRYGEKYAPRDEEMQSEITETGGCNVRVILQRTKERLTNVSHLL